MRQTVTFKNGNRLEINDHGFSFWDDTERRWVIDASDVENDGTIRFASEIQQKATPTPHWKVFESVYPTTKEEAKMARTMKKKTATKKASKKTATKRKAKR